MLFNLLSYLCECFVNYGIFRVKRRVSTSKGRRSSRTIPIELPVFRGAEVAPASLTASPAPAAPAAQNAPALGVGSL